MLLSLIVFMNPENYNEMREILRRQLCYCTIALYDSATVGVIAMLCAVLLLGWSSLDQTRCNCLDEDNGIISGLKTFQFTDSFTSIVDTIVGCQNPD